MPELPEVETTRRGIEPHVAGRHLVRLEVHDHRLRWPIAASLAAELAGQKILGVGRRAKYLLINLEHGTLLLHMGMSGSLRVLKQDHPRLLHDHLDFILDNGCTLRFNDPRRFGSLHFTREDPQQHKLLRALAPEPLSEEFDADYMLRITRKRKVAIKQLVMNSNLVVGVGNIYASEALFRAQIRPRRAARSLTHTQCAALVRGVKSVLKMAIKSGGTTLRNYVGADGNPGYFSQKLYVYERAGEPCRVCGTPIKQLTQGARSTYYCPQCQK